MDRYSLVMSAGIPRGVRGSRGSCRLCSVGNSRFRQIFGGTGGRGPDGLIVGVLGIRSGGSGGLWRRDRQGGGRGGGWWGRGCSMFSG